MKKGDGSESTIIIGPSKSVLVYVIGPYLFRDNQDRHVTLNGNRYRSMITKYFWPQLDDMEDSSRLAASVVRFVAVRQVYGLCQQASDD